MAPLSRDDGVAGVYGRQLPHDDASPPERFFLDFLYGPKPREQHLDPGRRAQLRGDSLLERELGDYRGPSGRRFRSPRTS